MPAGAEVQADPIDNKPVTSKSGGFRASASSTLLFVILLAAACAWVLHLPVFPSQDGPVHVYYARVARDLMLGGHTYEQQFRVARPFPPYSAHAYLLMAMLNWVSSETAEKLLACLAMIVCGLGVIALARSLGGSLVICSLSVPFLLNRYLFLGFYGYILAIGFAQMGMAVWMGPGRSRGSRNVLFLLLTVLTLFSHPVPYLLLIAFGWAAVLAGWWNHRQRVANEVSALPSPTRVDFVVLAVATALFLYIKHYSHSGLLWNYEWLANWDIKLLRIVDVFRTWDILPLRVPLYNASLGVLLVLATVGAVWQARKKSLGTTRLQLVVAFALLILVALPLLPRTMNGSGFFAERFAIWPPLLLIAAAAAAPPKRIIAFTTAVLAVVTLAITLFVLNGKIGPIARQTDPSVVPAGLLSGIRTLAVNEVRAPREFTYDPYIMAPVRVIDRGGAVLANAPWMDLQIMMLDEIGPDGKFTPEDGPHLPSGAPLRDAVIDSHYGVDGPSSAALFAQHHREQWRISTYAFFDVLSPTQ